MRPGIQRPNQNASRASGHAHRERASLSPVILTGRIPAIILCTEKAAGLQIAGLTLLDRLIVAVHRAGASPITVVANGELPSLQRTRALGIEFLMNSQVPHCDVPVLLASANVLVQARDVRRCLLSGSSLLSGSGKPLPIGIASSGHPRAEVVFDQGPKLRPEGVACLVNDPPSERAAEAELWASLTSPSDGFVDKAFNRPCGRPLSKLLVHTPVSPNTISMVSILVGVASAFCFANGRHDAAILGAILFQLSAVIDCVDGDIARVLFKESRFGKWLDLTGDQIVHGSVFAGVALGVFKAGAGTEVLWLGASAVAGALISFAVVVRGMRCRSRENKSLQRLIDSATNRDFSVLVLVLACLQQLKLFLWLAAVGSHLFWLTALSLQLSRKSGGRVNQ